MSFKTTLLALGMCGALGACGDTIGEQVFAGGAIGAGAAAVTSGDIIQGAAIGAVGNLAYCQVSPESCQSY